MFLAVIKAFTVGRNIGIVCASIFQGVSPGTSLYSAQVVPALIIHVGCAYPSRTWLESPIPCMHCSCTLPGYRVCASLGRQAKPARNNSVGTTYAESRGLLCKVF